MVIKIKTLRLRKFRGQRVIQRTDKVAKITKLTSVKNQFRMQSKELAKYRYIQYSVSILIDYI